MFIKSIAARVGGGFLRHVLGYAGAYLVARGWVDADTAAAGSDYIADMVIGIVFGAGAVGWSVVDKITKKKPDPATAISKPPVLIQQPITATVQPQGFSLSDRSRNNLAGVDPLLVRVVEQAIELTRMDFGVTEGLRSSERQQEMIAQGKSFVKRSKHQDGLAIDVIAYPTPEGSWEPSDYYPINDAMQEAANRCGARITWGGTWKMGDYVHFQLDGEHA